MAGEWINIRLGDVCSKIGSGATPRGGSEVYLDSGEIALIRSQNIYNDGFHHDGLAFITEKHAKELESVEVMPDDVLLNITGDSVARCCQVDKAILPARVNQHVAIIRPDSNKLDPRFLRYFLVSPDMQANMLSWAGAGATRNALTKGMIESFEVSAPANVNEQRAIAHIFGTLDDKIELNRKMNQTLEAMARAIFKSWFMNFDPVRAKAERRDPGLPPDLAALFPDSFEDSELGEIPKGWEVGAFHDLASLSRDSVNPLDFPAEQFYHYSIPAFDEGRVPKVELGTAIKSNKFVIPPDSVLLSKLNPRIPRVWLPNTQGAMRSICSTEFFVALPKTGISREYLFSLFTSQAFMSDFATFVTGTSGSHQRVKPAGLLGMQAIIPPEGLIAAYTKKVKPLIDQANRNIYQSRTLAALRDALLPKLLSGEIRVKDAEKLIGVKT